MTFAELLPKTNALGQETGELIFCSSDEGVREATKIRPAGKMLFITDGSALKAFRACLPPRTLRLVLDSDDCLPLFLSSDDASIVAAAGQKNTLVAARFFAQIRKIPCVLFPTSAALDGVFCASDSVRLGETIAHVPLKEAQVCCDRELLAPSLGQAYMRLLLARLALIEAKALRGLGVVCGREEAEERAYKALLPIKCKTLDFEDVALKNAQIRKCEREGMAAGEGIRLAQEFGRGGEEQAFFLLSALYAAFFWKGKPRLQVPDYAARAKAAGVAYAAQRVPTLPEFARRSALLERIRAEILQELNALSEGETHFKTNFYALTAQAPVEVRSIAPLINLPEKTAGLCAVMRDFGLMEWKEEDIF